MEAARTDVFGDGFMVDLGKFRVGKIFQPKRGNLLVEKIHDKQTIKYRVEQCYKTSNVPRARK